MITCMCSANMTDGDVTKNLIVGRQDGTIEVYVTDMSDGLNICGTAFVHVFTKIKHMWQLVCLNAILELQ